MRHPEPMQDPMWNYVVLGAAALFEGSSFIIALRQFLKTAGSAPFWEAFHRSKDPSNYTVLQMYVGPDDVLVTMDLDFDDGTVAADAATAIAAVERHVRDRYPMIKRLFIEAGSTPAQQPWSRPDPEEQLGPQIWPTTALKQAA